MRSAGTRSRIALRNRSPVSFSMRRNRGVGCPPGGAGSHLKLLQSLGGTQLRDHVGGHADAALQAQQLQADVLECAHEAIAAAHRLLPRRPETADDLDRKRTRLNSSHANISYAVFS